MEPRRYIRRIALGRVALAMQPMPYWIAYVRGLARQHGYTHPDVILGPWCEHHKTQWLLLYAVDPIREAKERADSDAVIETT